QELDIVLRSDDKFAPAYNMLGLVHGELREDAKAEASFKQALSLQRGYSEAHNNYGWFLCQRDRYKESLEQFEAAVQNPLYASPELALANAGICSLKQGDLKVAENYLERALRRAPNQPMALLHLADLHLHTGRPVTARKMLRQLSAVTELNAQALWVGARTERKLADQAAEAGYAAQLRQRFPDSQEAYWLRTGQFDQPGGRW
ncbi:MAG: type IV pilus biogenesis/stability protein PilW, partial [Thiobacillaceae bacterium]|nr:type IV pilus biogenesis/stability protein PilW [Thiobacillaceae bacterium]